MKLVTFIITTYNRYDYLIQAIQSILKQDYLNKEIIVVDDNSDKEISDKISIIEGITYIKNNKNLGASDSRKKGLKIANGEYVIFMDDDDFYTDKYFLSKCIDIFNKYQSKYNLVFVSCNANLYMDDSKEILEGSKLSFKGFVQNREYLNGFQFKYAKPYSTFTTVFHTEIIKNKVVPSVEMFNDTTIYMNALLYGNVWFLEDVIGLYRIHGNNISKNIDVKFLIDNLYEKYKVGFSNKHKILDNPKFWLYSQFKLTYNYYIIESKPCIKDSLKLLSWIEMHIHSVRYNTKFFLMWFVNLIKIFLKGGMF